MIELVLGGARSGKSRYAQQQAQASTKSVVYIATSEAGDTEMQARIERHQADRPAHWQTVEEPVRLADCIRQYANGEHCLLIECLTLWLSNVLFDKQGELQLELFQQEKADLLKALAESSGPIIMVSNEVGQGVVSIHQTTRLFVDEAGRLHQDIAEVSNQVVFVTAGLPQILKSNSRMGRT